MSLSTSGQSLPWSCPVLIRLWSTIKTEIYTALQGGDKLFNSLWIGTPPPSLAMGAQGLLQLTKEHLQPLLLYCPETLESYLLEPTGTFPMTWISSLRTIRAVFLHSQVKMKGGEVREGRVSSTTGITQRSWLMDRCCQVPQCTKWRGPASWNPHLRLMPIDPGALIQMSLGPSVLAREVCVSPSPASGPVSRMETPAPHCRYLLS